MKLLKPSENKGNSQFLDNNLLDRLAKRLIVWDIAVDLKKRGGYHAVDVSDLELLRLPRTFPSFREYLRIWEPLMMAEMRANIISDVRSANSNSIQMGTVQICPEKDIPTDLIFRADCIFTATSGPNKDR